MYRTCLTLALTIALATPSAFAAAPDEALLISGEWETVSTVAIRSLSGSVLDESGATTDGFFAASIADAEAITRITSMSFTHEGNVRLELSTGGTVFGFYRARATSPLTHHNWTDTVVFVDVIRAFDDRVFLAINLTTHELWYRAASFDTTAWGVEIVSTLERRDPAAPASPDVEHQPTRPQRP